MTESKAVAEGTIFRDPPAKGPLGRPPGRPPGGRAPGTPKSATEPRKATPVASTPKQRKGMETSLTFGYGIAGAIIEQKGVIFNREKADGGIERVWQPSLAGRAMKLGSPAAGKEIAGWIESIPFLNAILGPILGNEGFTTITRVAGLPILLHVLQTRPETAGMVEPVVMPLLVDLFQSIKQLEREQAKAMEALGQDVDMEEFKTWAGALFGRVEQVLPEEEEPPEPEPYSGNGQAYSEIDQDLGIG